MAVIAGCSSLNMFYVYFTYVLRRPMSTASMKHIHTVVLNAIQCHFFLYFTLRTLTESMSHERRPRCFCLDGAYSQELPPHTYIRFREIDYAICIWVFTYVASRWCSTVQFWAGVYVHECKNKNWERTDRRTEPDPIGSNLKARIYICISRVHKWLLCRV